MEFTITNFLVKLNSPWGKRVGFVLILAFALFLPTIAGAGLAEMIGSAFLGVVSVIIGFFLNVIGTLLGGILTLVGGIFNWVTSPNFISLSYTDPARNPFIELGWGLTRDLANIIFILAFVVIGLATALRIGGYHAKKTLPTLIIIALLINFTPVICGLIVDASNIVMNFFLSEVTGVDAFTSRLSAQWSSWIGGLKFWDPTASTMAINNAVGALVIIIFNLLTILVLLTFSLIFVLRYIAIWVLVILSPLAFACYILPATRGYFESWWKQFIQWSIIGITGGFFLYLANWMMIESMKPEFQKQLSPMAGPLGTLMDQILPYGISLVLLIIGVIAAFTTSATGATQIISGAQKGGKVAGLWAGKAARETPTVTRAEERIRRGLERVPVVGRAVGGPGAYAAELGKRKGEIKKRLNLMSTADLESAMDRVPIYRAGGLETLAERGSITDLHKRFLPHAKLYGADMSKILKARPGWAPDVKPERVTELMRLKNIGKPEAEQELIRETVEKMTPADFRKNVQIESLKTHEVFRAMNVKQLREIAAKGSVKQKAAIGEVFYRHYPEWQNERDLLWASKKPEDRLRGDELSRKGNMIEANDEFLRI